MRSALLCILFSLVASLTLFTANASPAAAADGDFDTIVVCPTVFRPALAPWIAYRTAQGHRIGLLTNEATPEQLHGAIARAAQKGALKSVMLVGDADPGMATDPQLRARCVAVHREKSRVITRFGGEATIASDNYYADVDGDGIPDLAVGRLTPDTPEELSAMVRRIIAYEQSTDHGTWRRQINLVAGAGGFGPLLDSVMEGSVRYFLTAGVPASYQTTMTYASWPSPFCPEPRRFSQTAVDRFNEGCMFWVYAGHGQPRGLDFCEVPGRHYPILSAQQVDQVSSRHGAPVALLFCCYTGAFDARADCLGEELLRHDGGPVAVLAGSRVTMPYGMAVLSSELLREYLEKHRPTLGELLLQAKRNTAGDGKDNPQRQWIERLASLLSPTRNELPDERRDHIELFNLLGDPLLTLRYPKPVELKLPQRVVAGDAVEINGHSAVAGRCTLELVVARDRLTFTPDRRVKFEETDAAADQFLKTYAKANDSRLAQTEIDVPAGEFHATLKPPAGMTGTCYVRAYVTGEKDFAQGASQLLLTAPPKIEKVAAHRGVLAPGSVEGSR